MAPRAPAGEPWSLSADAFERLLALLGPDRDQAALRYEAIRGRLARVFAWRGFRNAEELADATFDRVAKKVQEGTELYAKDVYSYLHGVALRIAQEHMRALARERALPDTLADTHAANEWPQQQARAVEGAQTEQRLRCLDECLAALPAEARALLRLYHGGSDRIADRREQARALGISPTALRLRAFRLRATVQDCVVRCCAGKAAETEVLGTT